MRNTLFIGFILSLLVSNTASAQNEILQLDNAGFEEWENVTYNGNICEEPVCWSSFFDGTGDMKYLAATSVQVQKSTDAHLGTYSSKITSHAVKMGPITIATAQGNLTNGCVNMGSSKATNAKSNYNYINEAREDQAMRFTGRPKSMKVWLKGKCSKNANVAVRLVTKGYYQDPVANEDINEWGKLVAQTNVDGGIAVTESWQQYTIEFNYVEGVNDNPYYALVTFATSAVPGEGSGSDYLMIDDIEMVYDTSGVEEMESGDSSADTSAYNIAGQRVTNAKGLVIKGGKKYMVK